MTVGDRNVIILNTPDVGSPVNGREVVERDVFSLFQLVIDAMLSLRVYCISKVWMVDKPHDLISIASAKFASQTTSTRL